MSKPLPFEELEKVYDRLAEAIDEVGEERESLFLTKLCLVLAHHLGSPETVDEAIRIARLEESEAGSSGQ